MKTSKVGKKNWVKRDPNAPRDMWWDVGRKRRPLACARLCVREREGGRKGERERERENVCHFE